MNPVDNVIKTGQLWRDKPRRNADNPRIRTLRVERVEDGQVYLTVLRKVYNGETTEVNRPVDMKISRFLSGIFEPEQQEAQR